MTTLDHISRKYGLNLNSPSPITIPGLSRHGLAVLFSELGFLRGAEIGVQNGKYSKTICVVNPAMEFYAIDPWLEYPELPIHGNQDDQDRAYENVVATMPPNCKVVRKMSLDAVKDFPDNYFDFVYIDGNHEFWSATMDIHSWLKKIRVDGIIAGHDYRRYYPRSFIHVYQVVNAFTEAYAIKPWFVTDNSTENVRSFFWVKQ